MATPLEYGLIAALFAIVVAIGLHAWPTYNVQAEIRVHKITERSP